RRRGAAGEEGGQRGQRAPARSGATGKQSELRMGRSAQRGRSGKNCTIAHAERIRADSPKRAWHHGAVARRAAARRLPYAFDAGRRRLRHELAGLLGHPPRFMNERTLLDPTTALATAAMTFAPPRWLTNAHLQSILPSLKLRRPLLSMRARDLLAASR